MDRWHLEDRDRESGLGVSVRRSRLHAGWIPALVGLLAARCQEAEPPIDPRVWRMVRCIECRDGEQRAVVAMGESAIPGLRYFLIKGPPDTTLARQDSALSAPYHADGGGRGGRGGGGRGGTTGTLSPPAQAVQRRLDDFIAMYRMRSSLALGLIKGDSARKTLCLARSMQFRDDVRRIIDSSLVLLNGTCP